MNVTIKQLQAFVAVAKRRSFAEACEVLHLSQPAVSIAIQNLEEAVGGKLFARSTRSLSLTPEGDAFYPVVQRLLSDWDKSLEDVHNLFSLQRGKLDIAAMPTFSSSLLPGILAKYHDQFPAINVSVHDVIAEDVVGMVREGRAELGVSFEPDDAQDLHFQPLFRDRFVAVLPKKHPLLEMDSLKWSDLQGFPFIALQRPSSIRLLLDQVLSERGVILKPAFEAHQLASIGRMVTEGLGVSVVPELSAVQMHEMGAESRPVSGPIITRKVGVIIRKRYPLSSAAQAMQSVLEKTVG